jgi:beta-lactamase class A
MTWGDWMCPELEPQHHLELERQRRAIAAYDLPQAQAMLRKLAQLAQRQDLIIRGATKRIAELELQQVLQECAGPSVEFQPTPSRIDTPSAITGGTDPAI